MCARSAVSGCFYKDNIFNIYFNFLMLDEGDVFMVIDAVIIKASYDLMSKKDAMAYSVRKLADDVRKGKELQTFKLARFIDDDGWDFLKFNFPVCGNLSSTDLMVIYSAMNGFNTFVVGNAERGRRDAVISRTLGLENINSVSELSVPLEVDYRPERKIELSFTNTQERGFSALPDDNPDKLILEMAGDQPLLYDTFRHALDLSVDRVDFAINLNAVSLMKLLVPSFRRNGYDKAWNSRGEDVEFKENNNFAQNRYSVNENRRLFDFLYGNRNGGKYAQVAKAIWAVSPCKILARIPQIAGIFGELKSYFAGRRNLEGSVSYETLRKVFNIAASPAVLDDRVYVDATNDDIFACWDMDGLNNDFLGYAYLFQRNMGDLSAIMPYAEEVYKVDEALAHAGKAEGVMIEREFRSKYDKLAINVAVHLSDPQYMRSLGIDDDAIDTIRAKKVDMDIFDRVITDPQMIRDLESHLKEHYLPAFHVDKDKYRFMAD